MKAFLFVLGHRAFADGNEAAEIVVVDIVAVDEALYIFANGSLYDLNTKQKADIDVLANILAAQKFAVLRPSLKF